MVNPGRWQREFPDYPVETMPAIPDGWEDQSWHNDTCPSFWIYGTSKAVFVDYADPALREMEGHKRFVVCQSTEAFLDATILYESDDWDEVVKFANAKRGSADDQDPT